MDNKGSMVILVMCVPLFYVLVRCGRGMCEVSFYHVFGGFAEFCVVSYVFGWASLYDANYRCSVG